MVLTVLGAFAIGLATGVLVAALLWGKQPRAYGSVSDMLLSPQEIEHFQAHAAQARAPKRMPPPDNTKAQRCQTPQHVREQLEAISKRAKGT